MVDDLGKIEENAKLAAKWIAAEFKYAHDLTEILKKVNGEDAKLALEDIRKAFRAVRYIGRSERKANNEEEELLDDLKEIEKILPQEWKHVDGELIGKLDDAREKLITLASTFRGKLKGELKEIQKEEAVLKHYGEKSKEESYISKIKNELLTLIKEAEDEIKELIKWIGANEALLEKVQTGFVDKLKELSV